MAHPARTAMRAAPAAVVAALLCTACGDRTALPIDARPPPAPAAPADAGASDALDASRGPDVDATRDAPENDATGPPPDAADAPSPVACGDAAGQTLIYVITESNHLYSFDPRSLSFRLRGTVSCLAGGNAFSMAVDRAGTAYVLDNSGALFKVDTETAGCSKLPYVPGQFGFTNFGMGFAANFPDGGTLDAAAALTETLFIEGDTYFHATTAGGLASLDTTTWKVTPLGSNTPPLVGGELTGTGTGELYSFFWFTSDDSGSRVGQLDKTTGKVICSVHLATPDLVAQKSSFAFAAWSGSFYLFTNGDVTEYMPGSGSESLIATLPGELIVGAGVSTCAP